MRRIQGFPAPAALQSRRQRVSVLAGRTVDSDGRFPAQVERGSGALEPIAYLGDWYECSHDCVGEPWSSMIRDDLLAVPAGGNTLIKATSFYDNEVGFSRRMAELALLLAGGD